MRRWAVRNGYRDVPMIAADLDVIRRKKEAQRQRRLQPGEEDKLLRSAKPHLQALIIAALETCGRQGEVATCSGATSRLRAARSSLRAENTQGARESNRSNLKSAPQGVGDEAQQSRGCALLSSATCCQRDRSAGRQRQTRRAHRRAASAWVLAALDLEEEDRTERQRQHAAEPAVEHGISDDQPALPRPRVSTQRTGFLRIPRSAASGNLGRRTRSAGTLSPRKSRISVNPWLRARANGSGITTDFASSCKRAVRGLRLFLQAGSAADQKPFIC
jgi:hypothetical protein